MSKENIFTVSQISNQIKKCLEENFSSTWIKGELSNFIAHSSGHWYFSLKDDKSQIKGVMFRKQNHQVLFRPKNGDEILIQGELSLYAPRGNYQVLCHHMQLIGSGSLQQKFEQIKQKLKEEGLFSAEQKKALPAFPKHILLITSPTGAALRDILQILNRRFKATKITLIPSLVQGNEAPKSLMKSLSIAKKLQGDVILITRGGGSIEDLWSFNDEDLARTIAKHPTPIISAVGHEIDFTICDFVSDLRAPTPSAGAELVVKNAETLLKDLHEKKKYFFQQIHSKLHFYKEKLSALEKGLSRPDRLLQDFSQRLDEVSLRLNQALQNHFNRSKELLNHMEKILYSLNPKKIMERGFSIVTKPTGETLYETKSLNLKDKIHIEFFKGQVQATITKKE